MESQFVELPGRDVKDEARDWPERARLALVTDSESYSRTAQLLLGVKALRKKIADVFDPHIKRAFEAHRALTREKNETEAPLTEAEAIVKKTLAAYDVAQEQIRREAQRKADAEARQREEDERLSLAAEMETQANATGDEDMRAEAEALIVQPAPVVVAAPIAKATPTVKGVSYREVWRFRITNAELVPRQYLVVNEQAIRSVVTGLKGQTRIPGVDVYVERVVAAGGR